MVSQARPLLMLLHTQGLRQLLWGCLGLGAKLDDREFGKAILE